MLKYDICIVCDYRSYGIILVEDIIIKFKICDIFLKYNGYLNMFYFCYYNVYKSVENR